MMTQTFKQRFWKLGKWFIGLFLLLLVFRLIYGYVVTETSEGYENTNDFFASVASLRKNYASEKIAISAMAHQPQQPANMPTSQKYEKTATVRSKSTQFENDVTSIKDETKRFEGVVQYEQNTGNKGSRQVHLLIGINPEKFDSFYAQIQHIGKIRSTEITKVDKTNEYRQLNAKKASLEKTLASLNELKSRGGQISDYIQLHDKILEIETQLQELGVELGNFDTENEFCTVRFSLYEGAPERKVGFASRLKVALEWTIKYYAIFMVSMVLLTIGIFILLLIVDKLKIMKLMTEKLEN